MSQTLLVEDLHKRFGSGRRLVWANDGITMSVNAGEVVGLLGHNGAGKTTLVNQIVGLYRPYSGRIAVDGVDVVADPAAARRLVSVQAQENVPITGISPRKAVELVGRIRGGRRSAMRERAKGLIDALDMGEWADRPAEKVSGGVARLSAFAMAVARPGALVVLDEPTNDVDPVRRQLLWDEVRRVADDGAAVLLVTHNVREAERAVDSLVLLDHGKILTKGTTASVVSEFGEGSAWTSTSPEEPSPHSPTDGACTDTTPRTGPSACRRAAVWRRRSGPPTPAPPGRSCATNSGPSLSKRST